MRMLERIRHWVLDAPERIAYRYGDRTLTFGELWRKASALSGILRRESCSRYVLYGSKEPELPVAMLGCLLAGKTYIPLSAGLPPLRFQSILAALGDCGILSANASPISGGRSIADLTEKACSDTEPLCGEFDDGEPAYILFTSGSTGTPKGVPISRENLDNFASWICGLPSLAALREVRILNQAEFSFDLSVADLCFSFCGGHTLWAMPTALQADPAASLAFWKTAAPAAAVCTPTFLRLCLLNPDFCAADLPELRVVYACGEVLEPACAAKLLDRFPGLVLLNAYGPTEATSAVCAVKITPELLQKGGPLPVGRLDTAACSIFIEDNEIVLQGKSVFSGYLNDNSDGLTFEKGRACYHTGDLGYIQDGLLYCRGRKDRQIKWKGYRIELDGIEARLSALKGVEACAVIARQGENGVVRFLKAFVQTKRDPEDLRRELAAALPSYMIPKVIIAMDRLPVTANGKLDRKELSRL